MQEKTGRSFTKHRYSRIQALLAQKKLLALADLQAFLSDQDGYPNAVCQHIDYDDPPEQRYVTIVSMIMDLTTLTLYVSDGPPDVNPYEMVTLA
jgi:isopenicillin-N N-acyltransferase-like protein